MAVPIDIVPLDAREGAHVWGDTGSTYSMGVSEVHVREHFRPIMVQCTTDEGQKGKDGE